MYGHNGNLAGRTVGNVLHAYRSYSFQPQSDDTSGILLGSRARASSAPPTKPGGLSEQVRLQHVVVQVLLIPYHVERRRLRQGTSIASLGRRRRTTQRDAVWKCP